MNIIRSATSWIQCMSSTTGTCHSYYKTLADRLDLPGMSITPAREGEEGEIDALSSIASPDKAERPEDHEMQGGPSSQDVLTSDGVPRSRLRRRKMQVQDYDYDGDYLDYSDRGRRSSSRSRSSSSGRRSRSSSCSLVTSRSRSSSPAVCGSSSLHGGAVNSKQPSSKQPKQASAMDRLLGDWQTEADTTEHLGPDIPKHLVSILNAWFRNPQEKDTLTKVLQRAARPANAACLNPPKVNDEIAAILGRYGFAADNKLKSVQYYLSKACHPLMYVWNQLYLLHYIQDEQNKNNPNYDNHEDTLLMAPDGGEVNLTQLLSNMGDSIRILGKVHFDISLKRRHTMASRLNPVYKDLLGKKTEVTDFLFGDNLEAHTSKIETFSKLGAKLARQKSKPAAKGTTGSTKKRFLDSEGQAKVTNYFPVQIPSHPPFTPSAGEAPRSPSRKDQWIKDQRHEFPYNKPQDRRGKQGYRGRHQYRGRSRTYNN